jgi:hypothetical protein
MGRAHDRDRPLHLSGTLFVLFFLLLFLFFLRKAFHDAVRTSLGPKDIE